MAALIAAARATPSIQILEGWAASALVRQWRVVGIVRVRRPTKGLHPARGWCCISPARWCWPPAGSGSCSASPPIRARPAERAWPSPPAPGPSSPTPSSCSSIRPRSISAAIRRRWPPRPCAATARCWSTARASASCSTSTPTAELAPRDIVARAVHRQSRQRRRGLARLPRGRRRALPRALPRRVRGLSRGGARSGPRADPRRASRSLSHGRHPDRRARPHQSRRPVGLRRGRLDRRSRRQPSGVQRTSGGGRVRRAHRRGHSRAFAGLGRRVPGPGAARLPGDGRARAGRSEHPGARRRLRDTMARHVGVERSHEGLPQALGVIEELAERGGAIEPRWTT